MPSQPKAAKGTATKIKSIEEFVLAIELSDVIVHEERARLIYWDDAERAAMAFPLTNTSLGMRNSDNSFSFRFRIIFADDEAEYVADHEIVYTTSESFSVAREILIEFSQRVAFMATYPFLRSSIFSSASRLNRPTPILGLVRQGEFGVQDEMSDAEVRSAFFDNVSEVATK